MTTRMDPTHRDLIGSIRFQRLCSNCERENYMTRISFLPPVRESRTAWIQLNRMYYCRRCYPHIDYRQLKNS